MYQLPNTGVMSMKCASAGLLSALIISAIFPGVAQAANITFLNDARSLHIEGEVRPPLQPAMGFDRTEVPTGFLADFDMTISEYFVYPGWGDANALAEQISTITSASIQAEGEAIAWNNGTVSPDTAIGSSIFDVTFSTDESLTYNLIVNSGGELDGRGAAYLWNETLGVFVVEGTGLLQAGTYRLYGSAYADPEPDLDSEHARGSYSINLSLSQVPIPPAIWLFGAALLGLGVVKRRIA